MFQKDPADSLEFTEPLHDNAHFVTLILELALPRILVSCHIIFGVVAATSINGMSATFFFSAISSFAITFFSSGKLSTVPTNT